MPVQITKPSNYPLAVTKQIGLLAQNIVIARKRRKETQAQWAKKLGVSQPTMARIERGDPAVAMASYVMCMWLINPDCSLADLIAPQDDHVPLERDIAKIRARRTPVAPSVPSKRGSSAAAEMAQLTSASSAADVAVGLAALVAKTQGNAK
jgi:DNA-binding XRE family transcriptional regulator